MTPPKCAACPFRDRPEVCHARAAGVARYCVLIARGRADYRELVIRRTTADPGGRETEVREPPSPMTQAANLAGAVGRFVASGFERTSQEERGRRLAICAGCEHFATGRCALCGCRLGLKVAMQSEHCPVDKW